MSTALDRQREAGVGGVDLHPAVHPGRSDMPCASTVRNTGAVRRPEATTVPTDVTRPCIWPVDRRERHPALGALANVRQIALEHVGHDPERGGVADLDERIAAALDGHADARLAADDDAGDRRAHDHGRCRSPCRWTRAPASTRASSASAADDFRLRRHDVAFDADALLLHAALPLELDAGLAQRRLRDRGGRAHRRGIRTVQRHQRIAEADALADEHVHGDDPPFERGARPARPRHRENPPGREP